MIMYEMYKKACMCKLIKQAHQSVDTQFKHIYDR